jgi:hypothetical protein
MISGTGRGLRRDEQGEMEASCPMVAAHFFRIAGRQALNAWKLAKSKLCIFSYPVDVPQVYFTFARRCRRTTHFYVNRLTGQGSPRRPW